MLFYKCLKISLIHFLKDEGFFERIFDFLDEILVKFSQRLEQSIGIIISHELFPPIFILAVLAFFMGSGISLHEKIIRLCII
jgi:hypothetical protein